ncbi:MAG: exosortase/archaeosortase family protein [Candidatus Aenigmarchaeota archaeon]|nr:exosortase/archaeosortase family protein [Candidatus Aenigmarchaeota archaeon]
MRKKWLAHPDAKFIRLLKFFIKFNLFAIPLYVILYEGWTLPALQRAVADFTMYALTALGLDPSINDLVISIPVRNGDWAAVINWDCTGWKSLLAYFALVMATDYPNKRKALGLLLLPAIFAVNLLRIIFMFVYVHVFDLANYQLVHAVIWSWGLILTILALWLVWMRWDFRKLLQKPGRKKKEAGRKGPRARK